MSIELKIKTPNINNPFVEYKRDFVVEGDIIGQNIPNDALLQVKLLDSNNCVIREVHTNRKYGDMYLYHQSLITYSENEDKGREKLKEFGFPLLCVEDINNPDASLNKASIKAWYSDSHFKAIIVSASGSKYGSLFDSDFSLYDDNGKPFYLLKMGDYRIEISLYDKNTLLAYTSLNIHIGRNNKQLIGRFNPISHKNRLIEWCKNNNVSIINDTLPGYLDSYLGNWKYHKGLLKTYRANDLALFDDVNVCLFNYLIDETSTSYETELCYLQASNKMNRVETYYYDIGEANIGDRSGKVVKFNDNEFGKIYRIDILNTNNIENKYYLDRRNVIDSIYDISKCKFHINDYIGITGVIKPIQLDPNDFFLKSDNTYKYLDYPDTIRYTFTNSKTNKVIDKKLNMERIDNISIGKSIYEFYNIFNLNSIGVGNIDVNIEVKYKKGRSLLISKFVMEIIND